MIMLHLPSVWIHFSASSGVSDTTRNFLLGDRRSRTLTRPSFRRGSGSTISTVNSSDDFDIFRLPFRQQLPLPYGITLDCCRSPPRPPPVHDCGPVYVSMFAGAGVDDRRLAFQRTLSAYSYEPTHSKKMGTIPNGLVHEVNGPRTGAILCSARQFRIRTCAVHTHADAKAAVHKPEPAHHTSSGHAHVGVPDAPGSLITAIGGSATA